MSGKKVGTEHLRQQNRYLVLSALTRSGSLASIEIGQITNLSQATISGITKELLDEGLIETDERESALHRQVQRGRPMVKLRLNGDAAYIVGIRILYQEIFITARDLAGQTLGQQKYKVESQQLNNEQLGELLVNQLEDFLRSLELSQSPTLIHAACQGSVNAKEGKITSSPAFKNDNLDVRSPLEAAFDCPCLVSNDVNMIAHGLRQDNPAVNAQEYSGKNEATVVIYAGVGVGMGLFVHGELFEGADGAASEFGHILHEAGGNKCRCGLNGCIEAYASDYAILRHTGHNDDITQVRVSNDRNLLDEAAADAESGCEKSIEAFRLAGAALGRGMNTVVTLLRPTKLYLCGSIATKGNLIIDALREELFTDRVRQEDINLELLDTPSTELIENGTLAAAHEHMISEILSIRKAPTINFEKVAN